MDVFGCSKHGECLLTEANLTRQLTSERRIRKACELCKDYSEVQSVQLSGAGLLVAMAYCEKDADRALDLLNWSAELSGRQERSLLLISPIQDGEHSEIVEAAGRAFSEVVVITTPYQLADESWPRGPNWMFRTALESLRGTDRPFYWLEPDCFPIAPDWIDRIEAEYATCGKPFMGALVGGGKTAQHMTGCGIYPSGALKLLHEFTDSAGAWDYTSRDKVVPQCHHSRQFFHFWSRDKEAAVNVDAIPPEAVIGHQCKTGEGDPPTQGAAMRTVLTYWEPVPALEPQGDLIDVWEDSWQAKGWETVLLGRGDAAGHPQYEGMLTLAMNRPTTCPREYLVACHVRWLAFAEWIRANGPAVVSDYDVMNLSLSSERLEGMPPTIIHAGLNPSTVWIPSLDVAEEIVAMLQLPTEPTNHGPGRWNLNDLECFQQHWRHECWQDGASCWSQHHGREVLMHFPNWLCPAGTRKADWVRESMG